MDASVEYRPRDAASNNIAPLTSRLSRAASAESPG
jgi:hypothetical protein